MNNLITEVKGHTDHLIQQYNALAFTTDIHDIRAYSDEWKLLGEMAEAENRLALAAMCFSRADYYHQFAGEYERKLNGSHAELIEVQTADATFPVLSEV